MVSGTGIPETTSAAGEVLPTDGKKKWLRPIVQTIDLETAEFHNTALSADGGRPHRAL
jgi:hypothetical protein